MNNGLSESQFYMWRTIFALAHADHIVTDEEVRFMAEALEDIPFSDVQKSILKKDTTEAQNIKLMFAGITDVKDQAAFFKYARELCHIDGEYGLEEQHIMLELKELHMNSTNLDDLVGEVSLELEQDPPSPKQKTETHEQFDETVFSFKNWFRKKN